MKLLRRALAITIGFVLLVAVGVGLAWILTIPPDLPPGSVSTGRLSSGPFAVGNTDFEWVDRARPTSDNGDFPGSPSRALPTTVWFPLEFDPSDSEVGRPLVIFSHGLMSSRIGGTYLAEFLASHGYVVAAADHPLTSVAGPGGPDYFDVVNQPGDVSYLIDMMLKTTSRYPAIDPSRIGVIGISLGANTATLAAFHPEWRDPRIAAAISIAGHGDVFGARFFETATIPFLMIAGTADAIVDYQVNAAPIPARIRDGGLLTIDGATHGGFTHITAGPLRILGNPDDLGCDGASEGDIPQEQSPFVGVFGTPAQGLITPLAYRPPCASSYSDVMKAGAQHAITMLAVHAFFAGHFADSGATRESHQLFLTTTLPDELDEVTYTPAARSLQLLGNGAYNGGRF
jgi:dienelactone hydrolase